ncbi:hypothetical protein JHW43_006955 [Diplocarpon mali]|nr:hypothetical protein JHW43_006955 [Diplocarpon mali]
MAVPQEVLRVGAEVEAVKKTVDTHAATETAPMMEVVEMVISTEAVAVFARAREVRIDTIVLEETDVNEMNRRVARQEKTVEIEMRDAEQLFSRKLVLVGYVEFKNEESVPAAIQLTGQKLLGIPIIAQLTEAEKNRQVRNPEATTSNPNQVPFHRLYVGNIHFSITESDLQNVFEPFGELEFVQLQKEEQGRSRGYGFVQFRDPGQAREALEKMNGFDLAGRPIRVGLGNDKFTPESTASLLQRFQGQSHQQQFQGSAFSGAGGRGPQAAGGSNFDRAGGRDNDKSSGGASALDDTDVGGVNFNNYSRDALMRKLARTDEPAPVTTGRDERREVTKPKTEAKALPVNVNMASRCVVLKNMFDPAEHVPPLEALEKVMLTIFTEKKVILGKRNWKMTFAQRQKRNMAMLFTFL